MNNKYDFPITECPYCGSGTIKIKQHISGDGEYYVDLASGEVEGSELHSYLRYKNTHKYALCTDCGKRLFKIDDELNVIQ